MNMDDTVPMYYDACIAADFEAKIARLERRVGELEREHDLAWEAGFDDGYNSAIEEVER